MSDPSERTFTADFRRFFLRGLVVLLPTVLTLWIVVTAYRFVDVNIARPINLGIQFTLIRATPHWAPLKSAFEPTDEAVTSYISEQLARGTTVPQRNARLALRTEIISKWWNSRWYMQMIGLLVAIVAVYIAGRLLGGFFGRRIYRKLEDVITSVPIFKQVYPYVKQIVDFLFSDERPIKFNRVVAAEYPRRGIWSVGFLTGATLRSIEERSGKSVTIFIPSSPTPFTGYTITVPREDVIELPISVEEAIRFSVSGGVLVPEHQQTPMPESFEGGGAGRASELASESPGDLPSGLIPLPKLADSVAGEPADRKADPRANPNADPMASPKAAPKAGPKTGPEADPEAGPKADPAASADL